MAYEEVPSGSLRRFRPATGAFWSSMTPENQAREKPAKKPLPKKTLAMRAGNLLCSSRFSPREAPKPSRQKQILAVNHLRHSRHSHPPTMKNLVHPTNKSSVCNLTAPLMKAAVLSLLLASSSTVLAGTTALIDMGRTNNTTDTLNGVTYNNLSIPGGAPDTGAVPIVLNGAEASAEPALLVDTSNIPLGWSITLELVSTGTSGEWGSNGGSVASPFPASLGSIATTALEDNLYINRNKRGRITFASLNDGSRYTIQVYSNETSNQGNASMSFEPFTGSGANFITTAIDARNNGTEVVQWEELSPEGGEIAFDLQAAREGWINFVSIEEVSEPVGSIQLTVTPSSSNLGSFDFDWNSRDGKVYDLVSNTDLSTSPDTWPVWEGRANIVSTGTNILLDGIPGGGAKRFFAVIEKDPSPAPIE